MTLRLHLDAAGVHAATAGRSLTLALPVSPTAEGSLEVVAAALWSRLLDAARDAVADAPPRAVEVSGAPGSLVVWDEETLGSARPVLLDVGDVGASLGALEQAEPHTWTHLLDGRYVVGDVASYVVARLTRGVHHVVAPGWPPGTPPALPGHCLPAPTTGGVGTTDPGSFLGLALPLALAP